MKKNKLKISSKESVTSNIHEQDGVGNHPEVMGMRAICAIAPSQAKQVCDPLNEFIEQSSKAVNQGRGDKLKKEVIYHAKGKRV